MGNYGFSNPNGGRFAIVTLVFMVLSTLTTILRIVSRRMRNLSLGLDDAFVILGTVRTSFSANMIYC